MFEKINFRVFSIFVLLFCVTTIASAQYSKVLHQNFDVEDIQEVSLDIQGEPTVENWAGNVIMIETTVKLSNATKAILNHFIDNGRYEVEENKSVSSLALHSKDKKRAPIQSKTGVCEELVDVKIYVPEEFEISNDSRLIRTDFTGTADIKKDE